MGLLQKLLCRPGTSKKVVEKPAEKRVSLAPDSKEVLEKQKSWLEQEQKKIDDPKAHDLEMKFRQIIYSQEADENGMVDRSQLEKVFQSLGVFFEPELFEKVYKLFDADGDGKVNQTEFTVTMWFLMYRGSAADKTELCYRLFDTNRDGGISRREFNDMIASILGNKLTHVLLVDRGREAFSEFLKSEYADELLRFLDEIGYFEDAETRGDVFSISQAKHAFEQFLEVNAPDQINVSDTVRETCRKALTDAEEAGEESVPIFVFDESAAEAVALIEAGPLHRFKSKIRGTFSYFADPAWEEFGLEHEEGMPLETFRAWSEKTPGLFNFFDALQDVLELSTFDQILTEQS